MFVALRRLLGLALFSASLMLPRAMHAQVGTFQTCSQGALQNCATIRLTSQLGVGPGGLNFFEVALQNLGAQSNPLLPTSIYFLSLLTGGDVATPGTEVDVQASPVASGGATVSDASPWSVFESGDAIFLSALNNNGVGGCAAGAAVDGIGQMGQTCVSNAFISFGFFTTRELDLHTMTLASLEFVGIVGGTPLDGCSEMTPCATTPITVTPEPSTMLLALTGLSGLAGIRFRRRSSAAHAAPSEA